MNLSGSSKPILPRTSSRVETLPPIRARKLPIKRAIKPSAVKRSVKENNLPIKKKLAKKPLTLTEQAEALLAESNKSPGEVRLRFNHYNKAFPIHNGVLKWSDVDAEYCFSFVYRGNYSRRLASAEVSSNGITITPRLTAEGARIYAVIDESSQYFLHLHHDEQYIVEVQEDAEAGIGAEGLRLNSNPLHSAKEECTIQSGNRAVSLLTSELKSLHTSQLQSSEAKDLLERRDIEDILYSAT